MKGKKTILVTGGCGFIASNYLNKFVAKYQNDYLFVNIDRLTYAANKANVVVGSSSNYFFEQADIRDGAVMEKIFIKYAPTDIINFAAETHVDASIDNPGIFVETNIVGTHNLLMLARRHRVDRFHQVSTDEVYGHFENKEGKFSENDALRPNSPYSASKASADLLVNAYHRTFGLNCVISRGSNTYGPNQDSSKLIPKFITNILKNKKVPLYAKGDNVRDWLYVEDHIDAIDAVFHKAKSGQIYNIGANCEKSNIEITKILLDALGKDESMIDYVEDRPGHDFRYGLCIEKIKGELGWAPRFGFEESMKITIEYYKSQQVGAMS